MKNLSWKAQILIITTILFGVLISLFYLRNLDGLDIWLLILAGLTSVTQVFKVEGATEKSSYNLSWVLYGFTFLLLGAPATLLIILVSHIVEWIWHKYPWYIQMYNIATYAISVLIAELVYKVLTPTPAQFPFWFSLGLFATLFAFTMINHFLVGMVIWYARGQNFRQSGVFGFHTMMIDFTLMALGVIAAFIWEFNPFAALLVLAPIVLLQNGLKMPALQRQTEIDPKTHLYNAKYFSNTFENELERATRFNRPITVVLGDLDLLRNINNTYGHVAGDVVLTGIATILQRSFRDFDLVARFGGEEFAIMMPGTKPEDAVAHVEAVREEIAAADFVVDTSVHPIKATMSFGISGILGNADSTLSVTDLMNDADSALYNAKMSGRNQTCLYSTDKIDELFNINKEPQPTQKAIENKSPIAARFETAQALDQPISQTPVQPEDIQEQIDKSTDKAGTHHYATVIKPKRPWQVNAYVGIVILIAASFAYISFNQIQEPLNWIGILIFTVVILLSEIFSIEIYSKDSSVSTAAAFLIAGALLFGPVGALIFSFSIAATAMFKAKSSVTRLLFNMSNHFIASSLVIFVIFGVNISFSSTSFLYQLIMAMFSGVIVFVSSTFFLTGIYYLSEKQPFFRLWGERFNWLIPYYLAFGLISFAIILGYTSAGILGLIAIMAPLLILRLSQVQYIDKTKSLVKQLHKTNSELHENNLLISDINEDILLSLANTIDLRDSYTLGHSTNVSQIAVLIAEEFGLSADRVDTVRKSSLLHDIGKIGIPDRILFKPDQLTKEEFEIIKTHPTRGADIVDVNSSLSNLGPIIRHHHEHYDGNGYPGGLQGKEIPLEARILCLADSVQAMSSNRPYRKKLQLDEVKAEISKNTGSQFDPQLANILLRLLDEQKIPLETKRWEELEIGKPEFHSEGLLKNLNFEEVRK